MDAVKLGDPVGDVGICSANHLRSLGQMVEYVPAFNPLR